MEFGGRAREIGKGLGRAFGGALLVALPVLMTVEMWRAGVMIPRSRLVLLVVLTMALVVGLSHHYGFLRGESVGAVGVMFEGATAFVVGLGAAAVVLTVGSVAKPLVSWEDALSMITIESLPAAVGASFARTQLGEGTQKANQRNFYHQELLVMTAGAVVFVASIAPTEEVVRMAGKMSTVDGVVLAVFSLAVMHAFVYVLEFKGGYSSSEGLGRVFLAYTVAGYVVALVVSAYLLWTLGRYSGTGLQGAVMEMVVLALPAGVGAAAARLVV